MARFSTSAFDLEVERDVIDVTSDRPTPNETWRYTDRNGHEHFYEHGYPTLDLVIDKSHWCMGNEGIYNHDPHEAIDESHYECKVCHLTIKPSVDPPGMPKSIAGLTTCWLSGYRSDGMWVRARVDEATARSIAEADESVRDAYAENALDRADERDIVERRFASR